MKRFCTMGLYICMYIKYIYICNVIHLYSEHPLIRN